MIPEDLERQICLAKAEVSEWGALGCAAGCGAGLCPFLGGFFGLSLLKAPFIPLLDLCACLFCGLKWSMGSLRSEETLWSSQGLCRDPQARSDPKRKEQDWVTKWNPKMALQRGCQGPEVYCGGFLCAERTWGRCAGQWWGVQTVSSGKRGGPAPPPHWGGYMNCCSCHGGHLVLYINFKSIWPQNPTAKIIL